jgi:hypothetical protein
MFRGKWVRFAASSADATSGVEVSIFDPDGTAITLKPTQRLIIQSMILGSTGNNAVRLAAANDDTLPSLLAINAASTLSSTVAVEYPGEGMACALGQAPFMRGSAAFQTDATGMGYIVEGTTDPNRQPWKESLVPGQ